MTARKLGKLAPRRDPRTLMLADYTQRLPPAPAAVDYDKAVPHWGMLANNIYGCCTASAVGHTIHGWTANNGSPVELDDADVLGLYSAVTGFKPDDPDTDQGAVELDVLRYWRHNPVRGQELHAFAAVDPLDRASVRDAVWLFGGLYIGLALPASAQDQRVWAVPVGGPRGKGAPGSWGGHACTIFTYDERGLTCVTWGSLQRMTWAFLAAYADEAYALLSPSWADADGAPSGFDYAALESDLRAFRPVRQA